MTLGSDKTLIHGDPQREESPTAQLDRNWAELLQELRVAQTGVQLLTGFLLTLPFQQRFEHLSRSQQHLYLTIVLLAAASTTLLVAPVPLHRILFRQHTRAAMVALAHWCALLGTLLLGLALAGVSLLIFDVVSGAGAAITVAIVSLVGVAVLWVIVPLALRLRLGRERPTPQA
jgi:hypothetical protein